MSDTKTVKQSTQDNNEKVTDTVQEATTDTVQEATTDTVQEATTDTVQEATTDTVQEATTDTVQVATTETVQEATTDTVQEATTETVQEATTETVSNEEVKFTEDMFLLTDSDKENVVKWSRDALSVWNKNWRDVHRSWISRASVCELAMALLATADQLSKGKRHDKVVLKGLVDSGVLELANVTMNYNATYAVFNRNYRVYVDKPQFNSQVNLTTNEQRLQLNSASAWTLAKAFLPQFILAIDSWFPRKFANQPICDTKKYKHLSNVSKNRKKNTSNRSDNVQKTVELAVSRSRMSSEFHVDVDNLRPYYNNALKLTPNLSLHYKYCGWLRRKVSKKVTNVDNEDDSKTVTKSFKNTNSRVRTQANDTNTNQRKYRTNRNRTQNRSTGGKWTIVKKHNKTNSKNTNSGKSSSRVSVTKNV